MAMVSLNALVSRRGVGRPRGSGHPAALTVSIKKGNKSPYGDSWYADRMVVRIAEDLWREAGFERGTKIEVLFDKDEMKGIVQQSDNGYTLIPGTENGQSYDLKFLIPYIEESGFPRYECQTGMENARADSGVIAFDVPKEGKMKSLASKTQGKHNSKTRAEIPKVGSKFVGKNGIMP